MMKNMLGTLVNSFNSKIKIKVYFKVLSQGLKLLGGGSKAGRRL
jgi:hypothetical protein